MFLRLMPDQIPTFWDAIKVAAVRSNNVDKEFIPGYLRRLLCALISEKATCFVKLDDAKNLKAVHIVRITNNDILDNTTMISDAIYSFSKLTLEEWKDNFSKLIDYAKSKGCKVILAWTDSDRVIEIGKSIGAEVISKTLMLKL